MKLRSKSRKLNFPKCYCACSPLTFLLLCDVGLKLWSWSWSERELSRKWEWKKNIYQLQVGESSPTLNAQTHNFSHTKNTVHVKSWNKKNANFSSTFVGERGMTLKWSNKMKLISHAMRERSWMTKLKFFFSLIKLCLEYSPSTGIKISFPSHQAQERTAGWGWEASKSHSQKFLGLSRVCEQQKMS